jgi:hypothetical protein
MYKNVVFSEPRFSVEAFFYFLFAMMVFSFVAFVLLGPILLNSISAENISDKFSFPNFGQNSLQNNKWKFLLSVLNDNLFKCILKQCKVLVTYLNLSQSVFIRKFRQKLFHKIGSRTRCRPWRSSTRTTTRPHSSTQVRIPSSWHDYISCPEPDCGKNIWSRTCKAWLTLGRSVSYLHILASYTKRASLDRAVQHPEVLLLEPASSHLLEDQRPILNFAPGGEVIPWGWNSLFAPPFF